jgi:methylenetetrahydrofolate reductase (NADPH)
MFGPQTNTLATAPLPAASTTTSQCIADFMDGFTIETTPRAGARISDYREHLRPGTTVYIPSLTASDFGDVMALARRLRHEGFNPVPHFAARRILSKSSLEESLKRLKGEADVSQALVIAGAVDKPMGEFSDSMQLLNTGLFDKYGIRRIGVAGHPEGSPDIPEEGIKRALEWKNAFAERTDADIYIMTQFCFDASALIKWDKYIQAEGNRLPIYVGVPGVASCKTLLTYAGACGIGQSMRFLIRRATDVVRMMALATPDKLVTELALYRERDSKCGFAGVHIFPFGGLKKSAQWSYAVVDGQLTLHTDGLGFTVDAALA